MRPDLQTATAIRTGIDALFTALAEGRADAALACFANDDVALFGSEAGEAALGPAALTAFLQSLLARAGPRFSLSEPVSLSVNGDTAWFACDATVATPVSETPLPYRVVGILVRRDGRWRWALFSGSEPAPAR